MPSAKRKAVAKTATKTAASTWGGKRAGAGRKPADPKRPKTHHTARPPHVAAHPVHVLLRRAKGLPSMRSARFLRELRHHCELLSGDEFRVLHATAQPDRVHLIIEADSREAISRGMWGLTIRIARMYNRLLQRNGEVWDDRYRERPLRTVKELRDALAEWFAAERDDARTTASPRTAIARRL